MAWRFRNPHLGPVVRAAVGALVAASALTLAAAPAEAHIHRHARHFPYVHAHVRYVADRGRGAAEGVPSSPTFSAIVVDANSGRTLYAADPDGLRHPASITKVMTLYLLFEQLESGKMTLQSRIPISEHAAAQEPSKLGLEPGETINLEDAIKAVVTRSANDIAVAIAEAIGGDESAFAAIMTRKAHALGMANTTYRNASGLPNDNQITTARDLTILARSLEDRFPRYFKYFSTEEFEYDGETIGSHNHLLGRVDGVDGIKTGFTRASGFNLLTSVHRDRRSLIAVVMGGATAAARDRAMENLIADHLAQCSTIRTATRVADASDEENQPAKPVAAPARPRPIPVAVPSHVAAAQALDGEGEGDDAADDDQPTISVSAVRKVSWPSVSDGAPVPRRAIGERQAAAAEPAADAPPPAKTPGSGATRLIWTKGPDPAAKPNGDADRAGAKAAAGTAVADRPPDRSNDEPKASGKGWLIQIGAADDPAKAQALINKARQQDRAVLAGAKPMTEKVRSANGTLYRARFAGLGQASAETACRSLRRSGFACFAVRD
jgi:D-alanyl-D-alanine carboxypeptidase